ncbi:conserved hypothetical protein [Vibrio nigripulchritudo MADA3029]|uniref:questin oxidase family protein n=1 Tax=Vibrio nigripulchritudo TaxID=28173 RepID=UPI0003B18987|nr:questin oxidase family protein [Vibrio nigripulchritudo]CCN45431.1 conserved hypothetical protein [Vibrio nigripulchritudo MADA3020]CCN53377.1 conserved hypothetical protein [Vibrio nigripulchritudo MADA3021]CCN58574.1 conserved hypothetical protein [Vibrio nigripulchritudo MADA3029]
MSEVNRSTLDLIHQAHQFDPNYGDRLSNHLPMALIALDLGGASAKRVTEFYQEYVGRLEPLCSDPSIQSRSLGDRADFSNWVDFYQQELDSQGIEATLSLHLPDLFNGVSAAAFHGLIRLSYAIDAQSTREIAHALAYLATEYQPIGELRNDAAYTLKEQLRLAHQQYADFQFGPGIIVDRIQEVADSEQFRFVASSPSDLSRPLVAEAVITPFIHTNDFTLLHGVTGFQAFLNIERFLPDPNKGLQQFWQAYVAAYCTSLPNAERPSEELTDSPSAPSWENTMKRASTSPDDHTIKLVYSCYRIHQIIPTPQCMKAAQMRLAKESL